MKKHIIVISTSLLALILLSSLALTDRTLNWGYILWKKDLFPTSEKNKEIFLSDYQYHQEFMGEPLDKLKMKFPNLIDGSTYPNGSYRNRNWIYSTPEKGVSYYWFDDEADSFGLCIKVKDLTIQRFILVKG